MKLRTWKYFIDQGFRGIFKNRLMSLASIVIVSACIFVVILSLCIIANVNNVLDQIENNIGVTVYLGDLPTDEEVQELEERIKQMPHVAVVEYTSADEALESAKTMWDSELLDGLEDDNPFPRSLDIKLTAIRYQKEFIKQIEQLQWDYEQELIAKGALERAQTERTTEATTQAATQPASQAVTQAATQPASQAATQAATQPATQAQKTAMIFDPFAEEVHAETQTQPVSQAVTQTTTSAPVVNKDAQAPAGVDQAANAKPTPSIKSEAVTEVNTVDTASKPGDADYEFKGIESIRHAQQVTETLITIDAIFKVVAVVLIAILCIVAIGIITNTIKLTVYVRKNEINIMKYVGATDWFIRWPFIIEGLIIGLIGAAIPSVLCFFGYYKLYGFFTSQYSALRSIIELRTAEDLFIVIIPVSLLVGMLIGAVGSISSIRKHLNV